MSDTSSSGTSAGRRPRAAIDVAGTRLGGIVELEVSSNNLQSPDSFRATLALGALPQSLGLAYWAQASDVSVELFAGFAVDGGTGADATLASLIQGKVDRVEIDPVAAELHLSGRDLSAPLFDNRTSEKFDNQTSSEIATTLAARRGLNPVVTATTTLAGRYYEIETARLTREVVEWDLLSYLAREEAFDLFVRGGSLYFQPPAGEAAATYAVQYTPAAGGTPAGGNFIDLKLARDLTLAEGVSVTVKSWNAKDGTGFALSAPQAGTGGLSYSFVLPGLKPSQALKFASSQYNEITRHERSLAVTLPGDTSLTPQSRLTLEGTGSGFDQSYFITGIERRFSFEGGFTMTVCAKNVSPGGDPAG